MPPIPHPLDMPKKILKQTIHSLCSPLSVPQQQNNSLGIPLTSMNKQRSLYNPLKYRTLFHNSKITLSVYSSALPLQPKLGFTPVNLSTQNHTCRNLPTYLQNFNWLLQRQRILERNDEKKQRKSSVKWRQSA